MNYAIAIIEAGFGYTALVETLDASEGASNLAEAISIAKNAGYSVLDNDSGGCCELADRDEDSFWHITVKGQC